MAAPRSTPKERERERREEAARRSRLGMRVGVLGILVLFLSGAGIVAFRDLIVPLIALMVAGLVILLAAFFLVRGSIQLVEEPGTKML